MSVLVIDFGSQVTQLIARRVREAGVYCEIVPFNKAEAHLSKKPRAIILSGGPASAYEAGSPRAPQAVFEMGVPVLGICYGEMTMCAQLGARSKAGTIVNSAAPISMSRSRRRCWKAWPSPAASRSG
jgi:GMP synthase (glutamine-hydrolysing)